MWCHWPVPVATVAARLPAGLERDLFDGTAWVGLVPFEMRDLRVVVAGRRLPPIPTTADFAEVNVRTYVRGPMGPGVWFDSLDASSWLGTAVARLAWSLPYLPSRIASNAHEGPGRRRWDIRRRNGVTGRVVAEVGEPLADPTGLDRFLTERDALYTRAWRSERRIVWGPVTHVPWSLRSCEPIELDAGIVRAAGYPVDDRPPHVVASDSVTVRIGLPRLLVTRP